MKPGYVYIISNQSRSDFYTGVTNNLIQRVWEHQNKVSKWFADLYNVTKLIYYEIFDDLAHAIQHEKQIKGGSWLKKLMLIRLLNPQFKDLYEELIG